MQQVYVSNTAYKVSIPILNTHLTFLLNNEGRLSRIIWRFNTSFDSSKENSWGNAERETWDLERDGNEYDLMRAFRLLALGNPSDFKELYYTLKEYDSIVFPCIEQTLKEIQEIFNFN